MHYLIARSIELIWTEPQKNIVKLKNTNSRGKNMDTHSTRLNDLQKDLNEKFHQMVLQNSKVLKKNAALKLKNTVSAAVLKEVDEVVGILQEYNKNNNPWGKAFILLFIGVGLKRYPEKRKKYVSVFDFPEEYVNYLKDVTLTEKELGFLKIPIYFVDIVSCRFTDGEATELIDIFKKYQLRVEDAFTIINLVIVSESISMITETLATSKERILVTASFVDFVVDITRMALEVLSDFKCRKNNRWIVNQLQYKERNSKGSSNSASVTWGTRVKIVKLFNEKYSSKKQTEAAKEIAKELMDELKKIVSEKTDIDMEYSHEEYVLRIIKKRKDIVNDPRWKKKG